MNKLSAAERVTIVKCLVDGNSMRATAQITRVARNTINKLLLELGASCSQFQDATLRDLSCKRIQVDGCWAFCYCKQKQVTVQIAERQVAGGVWTWAAIDVDSKLVPCWTLGKRDPETAEAFVSDLAGRLADRVQLTSGGLRAHLTAVARIFAEQVDCAQLVEVCEQNDVDSQRRYSPPSGVMVELNPVIGGPDPDYISASYIERQSLVMRMGLRRFARLTNALSKSTLHHAAAVSFHMMYYNFGRVHQTLKTSPAVAAGVTDHIWSIEEIVTLLDSK